MAGASVHNPHITEPTSDLQTLAVQAMRRYGDFAPSPADGDLLLMFVEFGNLIIDDIRNHPYWPADQVVDYYTSPTDKRPIPDAVVKAGLLFHYAVQQLSQKAEVYRPLYTAALNQALHYALLGNEPINMSVVDGGSRGGRS